ncbi:Protein-tyrosine sulfotransferase [Aphelenchoides besseyi]|nr:Protein-tyrosine sulfotransferase [Aphelenchoides besseyi]
MFFVLSTARVIGLRRGSILELLLGLNRSMSYRLRYYFFGVLTASIFFLFVRLYDGSVGELNENAISNFEQPIISSDGRINSSSPLIFIGGIPRSGTTLMRAMLDAHPDVRCGEETRVIPRILGLRGAWKKSEREWKRLQEAGVTNEVINSAIASFIIQVIAGHGAAAKRYCNKDPFTLKSTTYIMELFPNAKSIFMVRDGRATVHSIISRKVTITGYDLNDFRQCLSKWNAGIGVMYEQCKAVGSERCLMVFYEQLVLHPESEMRRILNYLGLPWNEQVLKHEELIGKQISVSKTERSTDQVAKPVNLEALTKWVGKIPSDVVNDMGEIAPMLKVLGYDPTANPPNYGTPDDIVLKKTEDIRKNGQIWYERAAALVNDKNRVDPPV